MITSEGTFSRESHIVLDPENSRYRFITPIEAERLQGFDDDWTHYAVGGVEVPKRMRYFFMGNSLVVPMITRMGKVLGEIISHEA
jgi:DNA (cytosine-5)-methyltransferase 1